MAPLDIATRALAHGGSTLGCALEVGLRLRAPRAQEATGFTPRGAQPLGERAQRCASADGARLGDAIEIRGREQLGRPGAGDGRRHSERSDLRPDITRDNLDGRWPLRHDALRFCEAFHAARAEPFLLGHRTHLLDVAWNIGGDAWAVAASSTLQIDTVGGVAAAPETRLDLCAWLREPLGLTAGGCARVRGGLQTPRVFYGECWTVLDGLVPRALRGALPPCQRLCGVADGLLGGPLCGGQGTRDRFDELRLPMAPVGCVVGLERMLDISPAPGRFSAGGVAHPAVAPCSGWCQARLPRGVLTGLSQLCHTQDVPLRGHRAEAQAAGTRVVLGHGEVCGRHGRGHACGVIVAIGHQRVCHLDMALRLHPIGGRHKAVATRQRQAETHQAQAAGSACDTDKMESHPASVEERQSGTALKAVDDVRTALEGVVPEASGWPGGARPLELFRRLTLGDALHTPWLVRLKEVCTCASIPAWLALRVAWLCVLDDGSHRDLLGESRAF